MRREHQRLTRLVVDALEARNAPATFGVPWPDAQHLSLSFVPDGTRVGAGSSDLFAHMNQQAPSDVWKSAILRAFQTWAAAANVDFAVVPDDGSPMGASSSVQHDPRFGDIRIASSATSSNVLAFSVPYDPFFAGGWSGDVVLNDKVGLQSPGSDLFSVMLHEAGHVLGIPGSDDPASAMYERAGTVHTRLAQADVDQVVALYGPRANADANPHNTLQHAITMDRPNGISGPYLGATPLAKFGQLNQAGDSVFYQAHLVKNYSGPVTVRLQTAGISLLSPKLTIMDKDGNKLGTAVSQNLQGDVVSLTFTPPSSLSDIYLKVESAAVTPFNIGRFAIAVSFDGVTTVSPSQLDALLRLPLDNLADADVQNVFDHGHNALVNDDNGASGDSTRARPLLSLAGDLTEQHFHAVGSLDVAGQSDFFQVVAPRIRSASTVVLTASVQAFAVNGTLPALAVCDTKGVPISARILANGNGIYTIQLTTAQPGQKYLIKVGNAASRPGNYDLNVNFGDAVSPLSSLAEGSLSAATPHRAGSLFVAQDQIFQFLLSVDANSFASATVNVIIRDRAGVKIVDLTAAPGGTVSGPLPILAAGVYSVVVTETAPSGTPLPNLSFSIQGSSLSDPIGPVVVNPTTSPTGFSSTFGGFYYYFALPVPILTPTGYLMYFPGLPIKQAGNLLPPPPNAASGSSLLTWSQGASLPVARAGATAYTLGTGISVFGGITPAGVTTAVLQGDGSSTWTTNPVPLDRGYISPAIGETHDLGPLASGGSGDTYKYPFDLFIYGGSDGNSASNSMLNYFPFQPALPVTNATVAAPSMSVAREAAAYVSDPVTGQLYAFGGKNRNSAALASVERYTSVQNFGLPATDSWKTLAPMPQARYGASAFADGIGHIFVVGGNDSSGTPVNTVFRYTIATDTWNSVAPLPMATSYSAAALAPNGHFYVAGGMTPAGPTSAVWSYNPSANVWASQPSLPAAVYAAAAAIDNSGRLEVIGGYNSQNTPVATVFVGANLPAAQPTHLAITQTPPSTVGPASEVIITIAVMDASENVVPIGGGVNVLLAGPDGSSLLDTATLSLVNGTATFSLFSGDFSDKPGTYTVHFSGDPLVGAAVSFAIGTGKPIPRINVSGSTLTFDGAPHAAVVTAVGSDGTQIAGAFSVTYNGLIPPPTNAGTYAVVATFASANGSYSGTIGDGSVTIAQALPKLTLQAGTFSFDGLPHPAILATIGVDGRTPVDGTATITYNGLTTAPSAPGTYGVAATFVSADANYRDATASGTIIIAAAPRLLSVTPNANIASLAGDQRSRVASLVVVFDQAVQLDANALTLALHTNHVVVSGVAQPSGFGTLPAVLNVNSSDNIHWAITFSGNTENGGDGFNSLMTGVYDLNINGSKVHPSGIPGMSMSANATTTFHCLFGDTGAATTPAGGTTGVDFSAIVNSDDNLAFRNAFNSVLNFKAFFDFNGDGVINSVDNLQFRNRFNKALTWRV